MCKIRMISRISREPLDPFKRFIMKKLCLLVCMSLGLSATAMAEGDAEAGKASLQYVQPVMALMATA